MQQNAHRESFIAQILSPLRQLDTPSDGLDPRGATCEETLARTRERTRIAEHLLAMDFNGDLKVERAEVIEFMGGHRRSPHRRRPRDGRLTATELAGLTGAVFDVFDTNRNSTLSQSEASAIRAEKRLVHQVREQREAGCSFAPPSPGARFIA